jgi:hypothetical protein
MDQRAPAVILLIYGIFHVGVSVFDVLQKPDSQLSWRHQGGITIACVVLVIAAIAWHQGRWWFAVISTLRGVLLPSLIDGQFRALA